jgi:hypothetical protein
MPNALALMVITPVLLLVVFGYAASFDVETIHRASSGHCPLAKYILHPLSFL